MKNYITSVLLSGVLLSPALELQAGAYTATGQEQGLMRVSQHAENGDIASQYLFAMALHIKHDFANASHWFEKAAMQGHASAQHYLGWAYQNGKGVEQDYAVAAQWYSKAAAQDYILSLNNLGILYEKGLGVDQDLTKAKACYSQAAHKGLADAQYNLGLMYQYGKGGQKNEAEAVRWLSEAHKQLHRSGQEQMKFVNSEEKHPEFHSGSKTLPSEI
ncbi:MULTISPECIES: tetratricopeptide repeat protein [Prosthecochloris]|uniref:Sel1 repeat family protein n=1 Tax=Prosthecochloris vibrioformis TaxID=1098 RepID=A0A5C4S416_PROVB|nr:MULTISPECIES: tetratricopeptide repeat protein [Prosthecochloris]ANT65479.1 Polar organelle development protein [Prosthecochloris sp. CIB 2401]TNJ38134.1 sel1 repeat family protein [Prosthecochloris vibrioformis]